jgi:HEAT repeat protein
LNEAQEKFWRRKPFEEFFDLQSDPDQVVNLIGVAAHDDLVEKMRAALDAHMLEVTDNGFIPEGSPLEGYEASRNAGAYPLRDIMRLAAAAARREPERLDEFRAGMDDPNEVTRFWAAQGLLMLEASAAPAAPELRRALEQDRSPHVRIVAAEALVVLGESGPAVAALIELLDHHAHPKVRLQAINALTYIGEAARPALPAIERAAASDDEYLIMAARYLGMVLKGQYKPNSLVYDEKLLWRQVKHA